MNLNKKAVIIGSLISIITGFFAFLGSAIAALFAGAGETLSLLIVFILHFISVGIVAYVSARIAKQNEIFHAYASAVLYVIVASLVTINLIDGYFLIAIYPAVLLGCLAGGRLGRRVNRNQIQASV